MPIKQMVIEGTTCIRTLRLKLKAESYPWLNAAAIEVNQVWNWGNATSAKAARPFAGAAKWLSGFDLDKLSAGASEYFEHIGSETIQRVNAELATRRRLRETQLRWRVSRGQRLLGWVPFKAAQLKRKGKSLRFAGKAFRVFEQDCLEGAKWKCGCFAQDSVGDWWLCVPAERVVSHLKKQERGSRSGSGFKGYCGDQRWGEARGGPFLSRHRAEDRPGTAPRPQASGEAPAPHGSSPAQGCLA